MTEFRVLGPVEVGGDGRRTVIRSAKARALLGMFLVQANTAVGLDALADQLWSGCPPAQASAALRVHISHLRKALQTVDSADRLVTRPGGYLLLVMPDELDAQRFATLAEQGRAKLAERPPEALATLRKAEHLWRGEAFADVTAMASVDAERARLKEQRLAVVEARIDAELACGRHDWVVAELQQLTSTHPLRERLWEQRIVALYRCGRQADALAAYDTVRALLDTDLGLHPGPVLTRLQTSVLRQDPWLDWQPVAAGCSSSVAGCVHTAGWIAAPTPVRTVAEVGQGGLGSSPRPAHSRGKLKVRPRVLSGVWSQLHACAGPPGPPSVAEGDR